jgi:hypothetical protein
VAAKKVLETFKLGDLVKLRYSHNLRGRIVELRGPIGAGGRELYRVRVLGRRNARGGPVYNELPAEEMELIPPKTEG